MLNRSRLQQKLESINGFYEELPRGITRFHFRCLHCNNNARFVMATQVLESQLGEKARFTIDDYLHCHECLPIPNRIPENLI